MTKEIWAYIKENNLQDPADKRYIICDEKMKGLMQQDRIQMFKMTKALSAHLHNPGE
jgi:upstream activation factor subunit UAF30